VKTLWVDASNGAAGDMLLAALLDAGADLEAVRAGLRGLGTEPLDVTVAPVRRHGLRASRITVHAPDSQTERRLSDVRSIVGRAPGVPEPARRFAMEVFERLAEAEAAVHGVPVREIGLHEVGALDAIADIVGCAIALYSLELLESGTRLVSPVAVGSGAVRTAHGMVPVPVPAVLRLLADVAAPLGQHPATMELCTPTGAALLATLATGWGATPACTALAIGTGAGTADPRGHPNVLRVLVGEATAPAGWAAGDMCRVDATIDDLDPRLWPAVLDELHDAGAADAWCTAVLMRKGRPGHVLSALADAGCLDAVCQVMFRQTTTLGLRVSPFQRRALHRDQVAVSIGGARVSVKRGLLGDEVITVQPEYDDACQAARHSGRPVADVLAEARQHGAAVPPAAGQ
jgi:pyridinium-3,5-bisthiocarboxylic acid mononucleotide nickel chelatase